MHNSLIGEVPPKKGTQVSDTATDCIISATAAELETLFNEDEHGDFNTAHVIVQTPNSSTYEITLKGESMIGMLDGVYKTVRPASYVRTRRDSEPAQPIECYIGFVVDMQGAHLLFMPSLDVITEHTMIRPLMSLPLAPEMQLSYQF